jgi:DNA-directed RNA polymerase subunit beta'
VCISRQGQLVVLDPKDREIERHSVPIGAEVLVKEEEKVKKGKKMIQWDTHYTPIIAEVGGTVRYEDIVEGKTLRIERDVVHKTSRKVIMEHEGDMHPQVLVEGDDGNILALYPIPEKAILEVEPGAKMRPGARIARTLREIRRTQDITGGLPRVTELFEARKPKSPAVMSEINGVIAEIERKRGRTIIRVRDPETNYEVDHVVPAGKHMRVNRADIVKVGEALVDGPLVLQDVLRISGEEALHHYMLQETQNVYRAQDVSIDDKHFEIIIAQMTRRVRVKSSGDTDLLPGRLMDKFEFRAANEKVQAKKGEPAVAEPVLLGITKAALRSDSFISAASFQNTTRVLTQAALTGKVDLLQGLKENVILGHLIPSGTGFHEFYNAEVKRLAAAAPLKELEAPAETS